MDKIESKDTKLKNKLGKLLTVGNRLKIFYNKGNPNNKTIHIRAIVDEYYIVYAEYFPCKRCYKYFIGDRYWFELLIKDSQIKKT